MKTNAKPEIPKKKKLRFLLVPHIPHIFTKHVSKCIHCMISYNLNHGSVRKHCTFIFADQCTDF